MYVLFLAFTNSLIDRLHNLKKRKNKVYRLLVSRVLQLQFMLHGASYVYPENG